MEAVRSEQRTLLEEEPMPIAKRKRRGKGTYVGNVMQARSHALPDYQYDTNSMLETIFVLHGSVIPQIISFTFFWILYAYVIYQVQVSFDIELNVKTGPKFFSAFTIFFVIFRLNGAHRRYTIGRDLVIEICDTLRDAIGMIVMYMDQKTPAKEGQDTKAVTLLKVDMLRWTLLLPQLMKLNNRLTHMDADAITEDEKLLIELDLCRCRGLLREKEFSELTDLVGVSRWVRNGRCCRSTYMMEPGEERIPVSNWGMLHLRQLVAPACLGNPHGFVERVLNLFHGVVHKLQSAASKMHNAATIPVPISYIQIARILLISFQLFFPLEIPAEEGLISNVAFPGLIALVLHSLDKICTDLEDPFGDDPSDVKLMPFVAEVEHELMMMLKLMGDPVLECLAWRGVPADDEWLLPRKVSEYLALVEEKHAAEELEVSVRAVPPHFT